MKKTDKDLVHSTLNMQRELNELTQDVINEIAPEADEVEVQLTTKQLAAKEGIPYITPKRTMQAFGKLPEKLKAEHKRDWEYTKAIITNEVINGEPLSFWYSKYPGDPDCLWEIPTNRPVYIPRMLAKHLEEIPQYHKFDFIQSDSNNWKADEFTHRFTPVSTIRRYTCRPIGAFS